MKKYIYLIKKYFCFHQKKLIGLTVCISLFLTAFLTTLWYNHSFHDTVLEEYRHKNGLYSNIAFCADKAEIIHNKQALQEEKAGIVSVFSQLDTEQNIWIGNMDENAARLIMLTLIEGTMPQNEDEIAIENGTYEMLGLKQKTGESIELPVIDSNGNISNRKYIITGILKNYSGKIIGASYLNESFIIPEILTAGSYETAQYIHVFFENTTYLSVNMNAESYYSTEADFTEMQNQTKISDMILIPMAVFFVVISVLGIVSVSVYSFKEQEKLLRLLRCIGFSVKKSRLLLSIQGGILWLASLIFSVISSGLILLLIHLVSSFSQQTLLLKFDIAPVITAALLSLITIFLTYGILLKRFYRNSPLRENILSVKRRKKSYLKLNKCWHKACGRKFRLQNIVCMLMIMLCTAMSAAGSFVPLFHARGTSWHDPSQFSDDTDYSLYLMTGNYNAESYFIQFPVGLGINRNRANDIIQKYHLEVKSVSGGDLCRPFFLTGKEGDNALLKHYLEEEKEDHIFFTFENGKTEEMIELAGGDQKKDIIGNARVKWTTLEMLQKNWKLIDDNIHSEKFKNGDEMIAPEQYCKIGDIFTVLIPIPDKDATEENINEHLHFVCKKMTVAATYHSEDENAPLIFSLEYMFSIDKNMNYEELYLAAPKNLTQEQAEKLDIELESLTENTAVLQYDNYNKLKSEFYHEVNLQTTQLAVSVLVFMIMILTAVMLSDYVQIQSNLNSYMLMRAIGADKRTVYRLILNEAMAVLKTGAIIGIVLGLGIDLFFAVTSYIKTWDIFLFYVLPVSSGILVMLFIGSRISVKKAAVSVIERNIIENLNLSE